MSGILLKEIRLIDKSAASVLEEADFRSDSEIRSLTREDLHELLPGPNKLKLRRTIFETINKKKTAEMVLKELQGFIPHDSLRDALSDSGVLVEYLHILKDMKTQLNNVQSFLDAHIHFLEEVSKVPPQQEPDQGSTSNACKNFDQPKTKYSPTEASSQRPQEGTNYSPDPSPGSGVTQKTRVTVKYKMVVAGQTFNAHSQILEQIQAAAAGQNLLKMEENSCEDCDIIFVFCPVVSRIGTDVEAAMRTVSGDEPVVLVLMHHAYEAKSVGSIRTWAENKRIVLHVHVFYHEKLRGLVHCSENNTAISAIHNELQKHGKKETITEHSGVYNVLGFFGGNAAHNNNESPNKNQSSFFNFGLLSK